MEIIKTIRSKILVIFSAITSLCSAVSLRLKRLSSLLPSDVYTASTLLSKIAATAITELVITRLKVQEMREDEVIWEKVSEQMASGRGEVFGG